MDKVNNAPLCWTQHIIEAYEASSSGGAASATGKYASLMEDLQTKTDAFMEAICATQCVSPKVASRRAAKVRVKPLSAGAYAKVDAFIASIDAVIKWHENRNKQDRVNVNSLINGNAATSTEAEKKNADAKTSALNEENQKLKAELATAVRELDTLKINIDRQYVTIQKKKKYKKIIRSLRAKNAEVNDNSVMQNVHAVLPPPEVQLISENVKGAPQSPFLGIPTPEDKRGFENVEDTPPSRSTAVPSPERYASAVGEDQVRPRTSRMFKELKRSRNGQFK